MPLSHKYLLVAAFLASYNPKESDESTFAGKKRGKRKKGRVGQDDDAQGMNDHDGAGSNGGGGGVGAGGGRQGHVGLRVFSLDRLASIFAQIASTGGVEKLGGGARAAIALGHSEALRDGGEFTAAQIAESYGDVDFFSSVRLHSSLCLSAIGLNSDLAPSILVSLSFHDPYPTLIYLDLLDQHNGRKAFSF